MKNIILFDNEVWDELLPLTLTRPVGEIRVGIMTIKEKWEKWSGSSVSYITQEHLAPQFDLHIETDNWVVNSSVMPTMGICKLIQDLSPNTALLLNDELIAARLNNLQFQALIQDEEIEELEGYDIGETPLLKINQLTDIFTLNDKAIRADYEVLTKGRKSAPLSPTNKVIQAENIFLEEGAVVEHAILNASTGPIYIGKKAMIYEGAMIRGSLAMGEASSINMGAKISEACTFGPYCKVGGEVKNSVLMAYSNKGHDGFMGNSVLGEWCNIGAGSITSNLKNNYSKVKLWSYNQQRFVNTELQFCGLIMGDHSKCGIGTTFNTGTVVGVSANIFGAGYPRNFIPSFTWGGAQKYSTYKLTKAFATARAMMKRRSKVLSEEEENILAKIFKDSSKHRSWDKIKIS